MSYCEAYGMYYIDVYFLWWNRSYGGKIKKKDQIYMFFVIVYFLFAVSTIFWPVPYLWGYVVTFPTTCLYNIKSKILIVVGVGGATITVNTACFVHVTGGLNLTWILWIHKQCSIIHMYFNWWINMNISAQDIKNTKIVKFNVTRFILKFLAPIPFKLKPLFNNPLSDLSVSLLPVRLFV